jgi:hypothetical protein
MYDSQDCDSGYNCNSHSKSMFQLYENTLFPESDRCSFIKMSPSIRIQRHWQEKRQYPGRRTGTSASDIYRYKPASLYRLWSFGLGHHVFLKTTAEVSEEPAVSVSSVQVKTVAVSSSEALAKPARRCYNPGDLHENRTSYIARTLFVSTLAKDTRLSTETQLNPKALRLFSSTRSLVT